MAKAAAEIIELKWERQTPEQLMQSLGTAINRQLAVCWVGQKSSGDHSPEFVLRLSCLKYSSIDNGRFHHCSWWSSSSIKSLLQTGIDAKAKYYFQGIRMGAGPIAWHHAATAFTLHWLFHRLTRFHFHILRHECVRMRPRLSLKKSLQNFDYWPSILN